MRETAGFAYPFTMITASLIAGITAAVLLAYNAIMPMTRIYLTPEVSTVLPGEIVALRVAVASEVPVNAFTGEVAFDTSVFSVESIDYNTSIADLWVTEPWHSKSDNTVYFAGGATKPGGFTGDDTLLTINLRANSEGFVSISLDNARVLLHDGLGTDAELATPIDSVFTATDEAEMGLGAVRPQETWVRVEPALPSPDLNDDGVQNFADLAIMMFHMGSSNTRYDLNQDGSVDFKDFSIVSSAR